MAQDYWSQFEEVNAPSQNNDYWSQFEEVQQPQPQPKNVVPNRPVNQELKVEEPTQDVKSDFQLNATKNYTQEMGADGRTYLVDENGNRVVNNDLSNIDKIKNNLNAKFFNVKQRILSPTEQQHKDDIKRALFIESLFLPGSIGAKGALGWALGGGLGAGTLTAGENLIDEGKINPVQTTANAIIGALSGGSLYGIGKGAQFLYNNPTVKKVAKTAIEELVPGVRRYNINKRKATPLADRMTSEQLERATTPDVVSDYGVANIDSARNKAIAEQMQANIETENALMNEYKQLHSNAVKKYGSIDNLKAQAVKDLEAEQQYGQVSEALRDYRNLIDYENTLADTKYVSTNIKNSVTRDNPVVQNVWGNSVGSKTKGKSQVVAKEPNVIQEQPQQVINNKPPLPKGQKYRSFGDERYGKEINEATTDKVYDVYSHEAQANNWLSKSAEEQQKLLNDVDNIAPEVMYGKAEATKQAIANGEPLSESMLNGVAKNLTEAGQEIEAAKHFIPTTPEGIALEVTKQARKKAPKDATTLLDKAEKITEDLQKVKGLNKEKQIEAILKENGVSVSRGSKTKGLLTDLSKLKDLEGLNVDNLIRLIKKRYKLPIVDTKDYSVMQQLSDNFINASTDREKAIANGLIKKFVEQKQTKNIGNALKSYRMANMLGSIPSRATDLLSTIGYQGVKAVDESIAKAISKILNTGTRSGYGSMNPVTWGKNALKGLKEGAEDVNLGINTARSGEVDRYGLGIAPQFEGIPGLEQWEKLIKHSVNDTDRAFYEARFASSYNDLIKTGNFTPEEATQIAAKEALENVFQGNGKIAKGMTKARNWLDEITGNAQLGSHLFPFVKTPTNLIVDAINRGLPIDLARGINKFAKAGTLAEKREAEDLIAKGITGAGITLGGGYGISQLPNNIGQVNAQDTFGDDVTGLAPQSVVINGKGYSLANAPYLSIPMAIGKALTDKDKNVSQKILGALANAGAAIQDIPMLKTIGDLSKSGNDLLKALSAEDMNAIEKQGTNFAAPLIANTAMQYVPASGLLGTVRTGTDPYNREVMSDNVGEAIWNRIANRLPELSSTLPQKYNVLGEPSMRTNIKNPVARFIEATASPVKIRNYNPSKIRDDLKNYQDIVQDLPEMEDVKGKSNIELKKLPRSITVNGEKLKLNNEQYSEAQKLYGQLQTKYKQEIFDKKLPPKKKVELLAEARKSAEEAIKINLFDHKPKKGRSKYTNRMLDDLKKGVIE